MAEARPSGLAHEPALRPLATSTAAGREAHRGGAGGTARSPATHLRLPLVRRRQSAKGLGKSRGASAAICWRSGRSLAELLPEPHAAHRPLHHVGPGPKAAAGFLPALRGGDRPGALQAVFDGERAGPGAVAAGGRRPRDAPRAIRREDHPGPRSGHRGNRPPSGGLQPKRRGDRERRRRCHRAAGRSLVQLGALVAARRRPGGVLPSQLPGIPGRPAAPADWREARGDPCRAMPLPPAWRRTLRFLFCAIADKDSPEAAIAGFESLRDHLEPGSPAKGPEPRAAVRRLPGSGPRPALEPGAFRGDLCGGPASTPSSI